MSDENKIGHISLEKLKEMGVGVKKLNEVIEVSEQSVRQQLTWLSLNKKNVLNEEGVNTIIRFLINEVLRLELRIEKMENKNKVLK